MKVLLLVNPYASGVTSRINVRIRDALRDEFDLTEKFTAVRGHATELASEAARNHTDAIFVLGGDGTLNEVVNGLHGSDIMLAPLPGGSTNVFVRSLGLPSNAIAATHELIDLLKVGQPRRISVGSVNGRRFLFNAGVGFDAAVVRRVEQKGDLKRWLRHPLYVYKAWTVWLRHFEHRHGRSQIAIQTEGLAGSDTAGPSTPSSDTAGPSTPGSNTPGSDTPTADAVGPMCIVLNTNPYTYLGNRPLDVSPHAGLDAELVFVGVRSLAGRHLLRVVRKALLGGGKLSRDKVVDYRFGLARFVLTSETSLPWQTDGDYCGEDTRWEFVYQPEAIRLLAPRGELGDSD